MKVVILGFEQKEERGQTIIETSRASYSANINMDSFKNDGPAQAELGAGEELVQNLTLDIAV